MKRKDLQEKRTEAEKVIGKNLDENDFIIPATDSKGHSVKSQVRIMPGFARAIEHIVHSRRFPYRTPGDVHRHALLRHFAYIESIDGEVSSVMRQLAVILEILRDTEMAKSVSDTMSNIEGMVSDLLLVGEHETLRNMLMKVSFKIEQMPSGLWKDRCKNEMKLKWSKFMEGAKKGKFRGEKGKREEKVGGE